MITKGALTGTISVGITFNILDLALTVKSSSSFINGQALKYILNPASRFLFV